MQLSRSEIRDLLTRWNQAWERHDLAGVMQLFHEDILFENWTGAKIRGRDNLEKAWASWFKNHGGFRFTEEDTFIDEAEQKVLYRWQLEWPSWESGFEGRHEVRRGVDLEGLLIDVLIPVAEEQAVELGAGILPFHVAAQAQLADLGPEVQGDHVHLGVAPHRDNIKENNWATTYYCPQPRAVLRVVDPDDTERRGRISTHGEVWGALSESGRLLPVGTHVEIVSVTGTKVIVRSTEPVESAGPPSSPPPGPPPTPPPSPPNPT